MPVRREPFGWVFSAAPRVHMFVLWLLWQVPRVRPLCGASPRGVIVDAVAALPQVFRRSVPALVLHSHLLDPRALGAAGGCAPISIAVQQPPGRDTSTSGSQIQRPGQGPKHPPVGVTKKQKSG